MGNEVVAGAAPGMPRRIPRQIETERLTLRCPREEDGPALHAAIVESAERLRAWFGWTAGATLTLECSVASALFARWRFLAGRELQFHIFLKEDGQLLGVAGLCHPDWVEGHFELSYWLRTRCEGQGYASETAAALTRFAFERLEARRVEIHCDPENTPSLALARRLGYRLEGIIPAGRRDYQAGQWRDVAVLVRHGYDGLEA